MKNKTNSEGCPKQMSKSGETLLFYIKIPSQQPTAVFKMEEWKVIFCFHPQLELLSPDGVIDSSTQEELL